MQEDKFCWIEQNFCRKEVETAVVEMFDNILKANSSLKINKLQDIAWLRIFMTIYFAQDIGDKVTKLLFLRW